MEDDMTKPLKNYLALMAAYLRINLNAQFEYRGAFISEALAMFVNDFTWVVFWVMFFHRFSVLKGWNLQDVMTIWAVAAGSFGIAHAVMGNGWHLPSIIVNGQLDLWMLYPRAVLPHLLLGRTMATAWGDAAFGYVVYVALVRPDLAHFLMFVFLTLSVAALYVGFSVASASLGFFVGNAAVLCEQWRFAVITFATYPQSLFNGLARLALFTIVPAAFVSYIPVEALRMLSLRHVAVSVLAAVVMLAIGSDMFYAGLRRYESGNLLSMHG
jgi:ABC-2 type transport system permease protein